VGHRHGAIDRSDEVTLSRRVPKSRKRVRGLRSTGPKARTRVGRSPASPSELEKKLKARTRELSAALERQTATSEVLKIISSSPRELEPVFETMLVNATRICEAKFGNLFLCEGDEFRLVAMHGAPIGGSANL
jgi:hypothetical protein